MNRHEESDGIECTMAFYANVVTSGPVAGIDMSDLTDEEWDAFVADQQDDEEAAPVPVDRWADDGGGQAIANAPECPGGCTCGGCACSMCGSNAMTCGGQCTAWDGGRMFE